MLPNANLSSTGYCNMYFVLRVHSNNGTEFEHVKDKVSVWVKGIKCCGVCNIKVSFAGLYFACFVFVTSASVNFL